jgi:hypothetical protein
LDGKLISKNGKNESILRLKEQLDFMKKEMDELNSKIELLEKKDSISEWENIERIEGKSIAQLRKQEEKLSQDITVIQKDLKKKKSKSLLVLELLLLPIVFLLVTASGIDMDILGLSPEDSNPLKTRHLIENLRGDTVDTWKSWRLVGTSMNVNIVNPRGFDEEKINVIIDAITSEKSLNIDDSITHKGLKGSNSIYYTGWSGALRQASNEETLYNIPTDFNVIKSYGGEGDIIITLSNLKDNDGYTGYTKSKVDGNEILKSFITIYDISNLTDEELTTIVRHEFGHALGLGHSTAPEDLMAPTIDMTVPYISECNIDAIIDLYNGLQGSTVCEK